MVEDHNPELSRSKCQAISALLPYTILLEQGGRQQMLNEISHIAKTMRPQSFIWHPVMPFISTMFNKPNPPPLNWVLGLISPNIPWCDWSHDKTGVTLQAATTSAALNPEEVHWSVADELLYVAFIDSTQQGMPGRLPARPKGTGGDITHKVQALGDFEILKSYLLLVWSEWYHIGGSSGDHAEIQASIWEEFCGIDMFSHRKDLIKQLNSVLEKYDCSGKAKEQCMELKMVLLLLDEEAVNTLIRKSPTLIGFNLLTSIDTYRTPPDLHVCSPSPMPMILHLENLGLLALTDA